MFELKHCCCIVVIALALAGCGLSVEQRGLLPDPDRLAEIHPGSTNKEEV
jgi:hypothetical protein